MFKKLLAAAGAVALASCTTGAPAYAATDGPRYYQKDKGKHRGHYKIYRPRDHWNNDRRYRGSQYYSWRYFSRYPSYYPGRCYNNYRTIIVRDPYTGRLVCMPRYDYNRYRLDIRITL